MVFNPRFHTSPASVSRSRTSRDDIRSLADEMLRASLTHGAAPSASASLAVPLPSAPPSYRRSTTPAIVATNPTNLLSREPNTSDAFSPILGSPRIIRDSITRESIVIGRKTVEPSTRDLKTSSVSSSSTIPVSAADAKARVRHLQRNMDLAKADEPQREKRGIFKATCSSDLLFLIDTTASMHSYINAAKEQEKSIVQDIKMAFLNESDVRVAVVGYKDHGDKPNIEFLDFTTSTNQVFDFLGRLNATGGADTPEDVLGGVNQALNASWKKQTRCIIHIADAPPHGAGVLHDLGASSDSYPRPGSEPHGLTYTTLIKKLTQIHVNYALLNINHSTDRMGLAFAQVYADSGADVKLLSSNAYSSQVNGKYSKSHSGLWNAASQTNAVLQFEEMQLGTTYSHLRHLVVRSVTTSISRTAGNTSIALAIAPMLGDGGGKTKKMATALTSIQEYDVSGGSTSDAHDNGGSVTYVHHDSGWSASDVYLEKEPPQWNTPGWLDETLTVEGFCPDLVMQSANSLNEMMSADENIKLSVVQVTVLARSKPFAEGALRVASYARTSASTGKFVIKAFKDDSKTFMHLVEDMGIQALCKAFALEFNGLLNIDTPIDFIVTTCLQTKSNVGSEAGGLSLEPFIEGDYTKYNSNSLYVKVDSPDDPDEFNQRAQAFSHFTFERSWGHFLVNDLQGVGNVLTDPSIQSRDEEIFKLADTNLCEEGFKFFFVVHECNSFCRQLGLKSNREMFISGVFEFREFWPTMEPTVCCSNKLCRRIVRLATIHESDIFQGHHWCDACWAQLQASMVRWICSAPGPNHEFDTSKFFYESQGQLLPRRCPEHLERDKSVSNAAVVGGSLWSRMKAGSPRNEISGRKW
jgi:hypothetical protein